MNFKGLIGFINQFINQEAFHLASGGQLQKATKGTGFERQGKEVINREKGLFWVRSPFFGDKRVSLDGLFHLPLGDGEAL